MQIFETLKEVNIDGMSSVALGNFDGIHIGHRMIMQDALSAATEPGFKSLCFTFSNHPFNFIMHRNEDDEDALKLICTEDEKVRLIEEMGFDILVNIPFDEDIMTMEAGDFFADIIKNKLNAGAVSAGFNYSYGMRAGGNAETLKDECEKAGIKVNIHDAVTLDGKLVSSTLIREMIKEGHMEKAAMYLGRAYSLRGSVSHGNRIGSAMGVPTVNIAVPQGIITPPNGVYFSRICVDDSWYDSVSNIGMKPTIGSDSKSVETNIFEFSGDLYGKEIEVYFDHFSRPEREFASKVELFEQIQRDCSNAIDYHLRKC